MISPKVSVIVPNYNHAPYLRQRLDTIFYQTFQDFEVIILDDCSTDNSKEIIEEYRIYSRVSHIVYNEKNSGSPFKQWARGFEFAQGEYIWIAESDDWADLNFLKTMVPYLEKEEQTVLTFCGSFWSYKDKIINKSPFLTDFTISGRVFSRKWMVEHNSIYNASCVLFKKSVLKHISDEYKTYKGCGDRQFWLEVCWQGNVHYQSNPLNYFRQHCTSTTQNQIANGNAYKEMMRVFKFAKKNKIVSPFMKLSIPVFFLNYLEKNQNLLQTNPETYHYLRNEWKKEVPFYAVSRIIVFVGYWIWVFLSFFKKRKNLL